MESQAKQRKWAIATDGSHASKDAFWLLFREFYDSKDILDVVSVTDKTKTYLPYDFLPTTIYNDYKMELISRIHPSKYNIHLKEKEEGKTVREEILKMINDHYALFIGYHGRKGAKEDSTVLGQTVKFSAYKSHVPLVLVKHLYSREKKSSKGFNFLVCLDGSDKAYKALQITSEMANKPEDKILVVTVESLEAESKIQKIENHIEEFTKKNGTIIGFKLLPRSVDIKASIVEWVNNNDEYHADFVSFGNHGLRLQIEGRQEMMGSFAETLIMRVNANLIIIP